MNIFKRLLKPKEVAIIAEPEKPRSSSETHPIANLDYIELLMMEDVIFQNVTVEELHKLIAATEQCLGNTLVKNPFDFDLRVRFTIYIDRPVGIDLGLQVPLEGTDLSEALKQAANLLNSMEEVKIFAREHSIVVCAYFKIKKTT
jgi:hypothetical protein